MPPMVTIRLFASLKERYRTGALSIPIGPEERVASTLRRLVHHLSITEEELLAHRFTIALNHEMARPDDRVVDGDELALLPPLSGGL